ncbi:PIG-L family deacetylase [Achromobacter arsenitoxydans]|uniref:GlcNAc-PI de-N-acetylase family protein n=1 Tax=Achromobacter arsenitoxydans SY8 TaxID=477184 RepID=H0FET3_9BURK|nr:PIG-L family deacetylase [Achromobacter arsenitoxydans]EHK63234.1 GlcNAc-PI de-N-acetylase family protein [Achromobacter arsenitoxydans SY8]
MPVLTALLRPFRLALCGLAAVLISLPALAAPPTLEQCHGIKDLAFVAHLDDDLLFMNPDVASNIEAGGCVRVVYLTASDAGEGDGYMLGRERGVRAAYAYMAHKPDVWKEDTGTAGGRQIARFTLQDNPRVQLWHMRLKDPWLGKGWGSLTPLSRTESEPGHSVDTLGPYAATYTREQLIDTLADLIRQYAPTTVRHLDDTISVPYTQLCWRCAGHGHPDHIASARLAREAMVRAPGNYAETGYIDYPSQERATNLTETEIASKSVIFQHYAWNDYHYCAGPTGCKEPAGPAAAWVQRAYYVSRHDIAPQLYPDGRGGLVVFAAGETNAAVNRWDSGERRWQSLGGRTTGPVVSFAHADGTAGLMARDPLGGVWANKQRHDGTWQGWQALGGMRVTQIPAVAPRGEAAAVALGYDGLLHWIAPTGIDGSWSTWQDLPYLEGVTGAPAAARGADGRYVIFAVAARGELFYTRQLPPSKGQQPEWQDWRRVSAPEAAGGLAAIRNHENRIELYFRQRGNNHLTKLLEAGDTTDLNMDWSAPEDLGVPYIGRPAINADAQGNVALAILERAGGQLWLVEHGKPARLDAEAASPPAISLTDGTLYVVARAAGAPQRYQVLSRSNGAWAANLTLDGVPAGGGGPFAAVAARPSDLPNLGANSINQAVVVRPSPSEPNALNVERMPAQTSRAATPTQVQ